MPPPDATNEIEWPALGASTPDLVKLVDEDLLEVIKADSLPQSQEAFLTLYNRYYLDVWRYILWRGKSPDVEAKDLFCEVWYRALTRIRKFVWQGIPIRVWLISIADMVCKEFNRKAQQEDHEELDEELNKRAQDVLEAAQSIDEALSSDPLSESDQSRLDIVIMEGMSCLNPKERKIIELTYFKNMNSTQIGQTLHMKPVTVRVARKRVVEKIAKQLNRKRGDNNG